MYSLPYSISADTITLVSPNYAPAFGSMQLLLGWRTVCPAIFCGINTRGLLLSIPISNSFPYDLPYAVIVESTYGVSRHLPRDQRERLLLQRITDTLLQGGRVLLPVVALGRAQVCAAVRSCVRALQGGPAEG